ncbi:hypothetical protein [Amycolatopsis sp. VC5-11]|uniref:hypothetical protein n=1 Tax=Amycolatopsis sp. VC5-11 TaxID=3120156 RepID=UPI00300BB663
MDREEKARENRLRRAADRQGLILVKARVRDPRALGYGLYSLIDDTAGNRYPTAQARQSRYCTLTLDNVEKTLNGE